MFSLLRHDNPFKTGMIEQEMPNLVGRIPPDDAVDHHHQVLRQHRLRRGCIPRVQPAAPRRLRLHPPTTAGIPIRRPPQPPKQPHRPAPPSRRLRPPPPPWPWPAPLRTEAGHSPRRPACDYAGDGGCAGGGERSDRRAERRRRDHASPGVQVRGADSLTVETSIVFLESAEIDF